MQVNFPWGLILIFISLFLFYYINRVSKNRREDRRDRLHEKRQEFLDSLLKKQKTEEPQKEEKQPSSDK